MDYKARMDFQRPLVFELGLGRHKPRTKPLREVFQAEPQFSYTCSLHARWKDQLD